MLEEISAGNLEETIRDLVGFGTRHTLSSRSDPERGIGAATAWVVERFEEYAASTSLTVETQTFVQPPGRRNPEPVEVTNAIATLRGARPESAGRVYIVSGHLDSRCGDPLDFTSDAPGADDDASGVAAVLELARVMSTRSFDATIVFAVFAGEEQGTLGSTFYAEQANAAGVDVAGVLSNDTIGSSLGMNGIRERNAVRLYAEGPPANETPDEAAARQATGGENDTPPRQLARFIRAAAERAVPEMDVRIIYRRDRFQRGSDHEPFLDRRYPAVRLTEPNEDYRHQHQDVRTEGGVRYGDLPEFVDFEYAAGVTRVNLAALTALANGPAAPRALRIAPSGVDTRLEWERNREPDLAGYEIVYRDTTAPYWQHAIPVGDVTDFTVEGITQDSFLLGVQAVDRDGNRSVVAFPAPR